MKGLLPAAAHPTLGVGVIMAAMADAMRSYNVPSHEAKEGATQHAQFVSCVGSGAREGCECTKQSLSALPVGWRRCCLRRIHGAAAAAAVVAPVVTLLHLGSAQQGAASSLAECHVAVPSRCIQPGQVAVACPTLPGQPEVATACPSQHTRQAPPLPPRAAHSPCPGWG